MIDKEQIHKLETLLGKVEERLWHMEQRLPENERQTFRKQVRDPMNSYNNIIVEAVEQYIQKEGS